MELNIISVKTRGDLVRLSNELKLYEKKYRDAEVSFYRDRIASYVEKSLKSIDEFLKDANNENFQIISHMGSYDIEIWGSERIEEEKVVLEQIENLAAEYINKKKVANKTLYNLFNNNPYLVEKLLNIDSFSLDNDGLIEFESIQFYRGCGLFTSDLMLNLNNLKDAQDDVIYCCLIYSSDGLDHSYIREISDWIFFPRHFSPEKAYRFMKKLNELCDEKGALRVINQLIKKDCSTADTFIVKEDNWEEVLSV